MFDPKVGLEQLLKGGLDNPHWIGVETLDGKNIYHVQGSIDGARVQGMSGGLISKGPVDVDLWIEPNTYLPRKAVIVDKDSDPGKAHDVDDDVLVVWQRREHYGTESAIVR